MRSLLRRIGLYFHTVRYLRPEQVLWRLWLRGRAPLDRLGWPRLTAVARAMVLETGMAHLLPGLAFLPDLLPDSEKERLVAQARDITALRFTFLNETREFPEGLDWHPAGASLLWKYNLHYFDYAVALGLAARVGPAAERNRYFEVFRSLVESWIAGNPPGLGDGWRPYPLSLRIVNWLYAFRAFEPDLAREPAFRQRLAESIGLQALYLQRLLEFDVGGNHLVKNAKALFLAGLFGSGKAAMDLVVAGERILLRQLPVQVLSDGGHYERSAHYHKIVLIDYLECWAAAQAAGRQWPEAARERLRAMAGFLVGCLHPDGDIPLFGDAGLEPPRPVEVLAAARVLLGEPILPEGCNISWLALEGASPWSLAVAGEEVAGMSSGIFPGATSKGKGVASWAYPETGWFFLEAGGGHAVVDAGPPCPPDLPAHAHSDGLSVEISWDGRRLIVDPGAYLYQHQPWRDYLRSTAAHNTVSVDGLEQTETWGQFRAARRAKPLSVRCWTGGGWAGFQGSLRYGTDPRLVHTRWIALWPGGFLMVDKLSYVPAPARARILLAPGFSITIDSPAALVLDGPLGRFTAMAAGGLRRLLPPPNPGPAWYSPRYGVIEPAVTLEWDPTPTGVFAFALLPGEVADPSLAVRHCESDRTEIRIKGDGLNLGAACTEGGLGLTISSYGG